MGEAKRKREGRAARYGAQVPMLEKLTVTVDKATADDLRAEKNAGAYPGTAAEFAGAILQTALNHMRVAREAKEQSQRLVAPATTAQIQQVLAAPVGKRTPR